jgi:hypothetical protein
MEVKLTFPESCRDKELFSIEGKKNVKYDIMAFCGSLLFHSYQMIEDFKNEIIPSEGDCNSIYQDFLSDFKLKPKDNPFIAVNPPKVPPRGHVLEWSFWYKDIIHGKECLLPHPVPLKEIQKIFFEIMALRLFIDTWFDRKITDFTFLPLYSDIFQSFLVMTKDQKYPASYFLQERYKNIQLCPVISEKGKLCIEHKFNDIMAACWFEVFYVMQNKERYRFKICPHCGTAFKIPPTHPKTKHCQSEKCKYASLNKK